MRVKQGYDKIISITIKVNFMNFTLNLCSVQCRYWVGNKWIINSNRIWYTKNNLLLCRIMNDV